MLTKLELLRVLDPPQLQGGLAGEASPANTPPLHTNAAEADIREYVTRRKISGGTRHPDGRRARDTFTGLKKTETQARLFVLAVLVVPLAGG